MKKLWKDIINNCQKDNSPSERAGWILIAACLIVFALYLKLPILICLGLGIFIFVLAILLNVNKPAVVMAATLFFIIWTSVLQIRSFEIRNRPYVSFSDANPSYDKQDHKFGVITNIVNSGSQTALVRRYEVYIGSENTKAEAIVCNFNVVDKMWKNFIVLPGNAHEVRSTFFTMGESDYTRYEGKYRFMCIAIEYDFINTKGDKSRYNFWTLYRITKDGKLDFETIESGTDKIDKVTVAKKIQDIAKEIENLRRD